MKDTLYPHTTFTEDEYGIHYHTDDPKEKLLWAMQLEDSKAVREAKTVEEKVRANDRLLWHAHQCFSLDGKEIVYKGLEAQRKRLEKEGYSEEEIFRTVVLENTETVEMPPVNGAVLVIHIAALRKPTTEEFERYGYFMVEGFVDEPVTIKDRSFKRGEFVRFAPQLAESAIPFAGFLSHDYIDCL